jgi:hypothetical protein
MKQGDEKEQKTVLAGSELSDRLDVCTLVADLA